VVTNDTDAERDKGEAQRGDTMPQHPAKEQMA
jgi:hypothetical protein